MCGINGVIAFGSNQQEAARKVVKMNNLIVHRGPDDFGEHFENTDAFSLGMGMRRLSIIDIKTGHQPMYSDDQQIVICFNGEIYNFPELKKKLVSEGVCFKTTSDTEVVLRMYEKEGTTAFNKLDGMFAFSIYDKRRQKLVIARDYFGEKPLYYTKTNDSFIWASELKSIVNTLDKNPIINRNSVNIFLQLTYIPAPYTIYDNINKLEANHYISFDCNSFDFTINEIVHNFKKYQKNTKHEAAKIVHDLVQESVYHRSNSDVPLGTFLSGGVDSSIVSLCLAQQNDKKIETFSIGFENKLFDESYNSRLVSKLINSNHHEFIISEKDLSNKIDQILLNFDEPFADSSSLATYLVSSKTKDFVKVALTGDGGDEVFGGYNKYFMGRLNQKYSSLIPQIIHRNTLEFVNKILATKLDSRGIRFKLKRLFNSINYGNDFYYNIISLGFHETELVELLNSNIFIENALSYYKSKIDGENKTVTDFRNIDKIMSLEGDMLVKVDRVSMLASIECRAPFLNKEIWNYTNQLPDSFLINGWDKKHILKEAFKDYFPKNFLNKSKKGFGVPVGDWLRSELRVELLSYIDRVFIVKQNIFEYDVISKLVLDHLSSKVDNTFRVWTFYCFQKWYAITHEA
jgi:asparagine synthase (glutamine-hydrolysing)